MKRLNKYQVVIIAAIVVAIFTIVLGVNHYTRKVQSDKAATTAPAVAEPTTREQLTSDLYSFVERFYAQYTAVPANGSSVTDQHNLALSGFGSQTAINTFVNQEKQCVQGVYSSVIVDGVTQIDAPYKIGVTYRSDDGSDQQANVTVSVDGKAYLIDGISC